jgi:hypothetical protein
VCTLGPHEGAAVSNNYREVEQYYPLFDIPLTETYSLPGVKPLDPDFYYQSDNTVEDQEIVISLPPALNDSSVYILFTNKSGLGGVSLSRNDSNNLMTCVNFPGAKSNINAGETLVYRENPGGIQSMRIRPAGIGFGEMVYRPGFVYSFVFDGLSAALTDARPLHRIAEKGWVKNLNEAEDIPCLAADGAGNLSVFTSVKDGIGYYSLTAAGGNELGKTAAVGENAFVYDVIPAGEGDLLAAGGSGLDDNCIPTLWKKTGEAMARYPFAASYHNGIFFTLAQKDSNTILAAGSALQEGKSGDYTAYLRALRDQGTRMAGLWELGPKDLDGKYGEVRSAMYDAKNDIWRATGKMLEYDSLGNLITGAYLMEIDTNGKILKIDSSFKGFSFYKITGAKDGSYFLIGEEEKGNDSNAAVIKYDESGKLIWRQKIQLPAFSYYYDALFDGENGQIVLAGTMGAGDPGGTGGTPFIQGIESASGGETWRSELRDRNFQGACLVSAIVKAPEYGYAAALCGIAGGNSEKPYLIIRINERGEIK